MLCSGLVQLTVGLCEYTGIALYAVEIEQHPLDAN